jgi:energy-coupling factor transporter ATP-binding protein EcfA2
MDARAIGFPGELLGRPWAERLLYFRNYTMAHPRLAAARESLLSAIREMEANSLVLVLGPTGVGKTTLRAKAEQMLTVEMMPELATDAGRLPVVSVECIAPDSGIFNWRDHFRRLLLQMDEPLVDYKLRLEAPAHSGQRVASFMPATRAVGLEYRHAVEQALRFRRPAAVLLDEAQHLARMGSGRRLSDQLDVIKSIANRTGTVHVLFGTYELLAFRNLSAQLSRRSVDIHFPRYRVDDANDRKAFLGVLRSFEQQLPLPEPTDLVQEWEFLYERSIGCVGILKDWLARTLAGALKRNATCLTLKELRTHALSISQCEKMLSEALEGESRLVENKEHCNRLRTRLGLSLQEASPKDTSMGMLEQTRIENTSPQKRRSKPGQRRPVRDPIGFPATRHATAVSL